MLRYARRNIFGFYMDHFFLEFPKNLTQSQGFVNFSETNKETFYLKGYKQSSY
jgi:hypothetical protein